MSEVKSELFIEEAKKSYEILYEKIMFVDKYRMLKPHWIKFHNYIEKLQKENEDYEKARKDGTLSDGYHTYNDLYYQRCVLFATICNSNKSISWKSKKHSDGKKCFDSDNWFIVGIDTPQGSYTYHYEIKYWDLFKVQELELGKEWDGHTDKDVTRLLSLINNNIPKDKIKNDLRVCREVYDREMKPYRTSDGRFLDVSRLSKKEKENLIRLRDNLQVQMATYELILEQSEEV